MLKSEFEKLAGYSVSSEDYYDILEPIYMATDLDKKSFVDAVSRKRLEKKEGKIFRNFSFGKKNKGRNSFLRKRNSMEQKKN